MIDMFRIYPYNTASESVKKLKGVLNAKVIKLNNSRYKYRAGHSVINWGNSRRPSWMTTDVPVLNSPESIAISSDKLATFTALEHNDVPTVPWTDDKSLAQDWLTNGYKVFVRHSLTSHSGEGIEVMESSVPEINITLNQIAGQLTQLGKLDLAEATLDELVPLNTNLPDAPLYTLGVENHGEYRVHVFDGEVILYQKKSRKVDEDGEVELAEGEHADVRNLASNWVYRTGNLRRLERVEELAIAAVHALGLDFGAVDIIKDENGDVFMLEVNTAPGLGNTETLAAYVRAFNREPAELPDEVTTDV